jgi:hypothetical protein
VVQIPPQMHVLPSNYGKQLPAGNIPNTSFVIGIRNPDPNSLL